MGSNASKNNSTAGCSPAVEVCDKTDPRSPTPEIVRTPLHSNNGSKRNITKNVDLRKTFETAAGEEKLVHNNPILSAVIRNHLQSYDPRSPTQDFERTPIVLPSKVDELEIDGKTTKLNQAEQYGSPCLLKDTEDKDNNNTFDAKDDLVVKKNLCNGFFDLSLNDTMREPETPIGSSTASNDSIEKNMSNSIVEKPTELLETNFDFVEPGNDKCDVTPVSDVVEDLKDNIKLKPHFKIMENDPRSPSVGIERTPIVVPKDNAVIEEMSDDTLIKVLQHTNVELRQACQPQAAHSEKLLIYEDEATNNASETPKKRQVNSNSGSRTPLSCVKNKSEGHARSKSANPCDNCESHNKMDSAKMPKRLSQIPRLKSLTLTKQQFGHTVSSISLKNISKASESGDCENTPPTSHRDIWDKESSIVL